MKNYYLPILVKKYLHNQCSEDEANIVLQYLNTDEGQACLSSLIDKDIAYIDDVTKRSKAHAADYESILSKIYQNITTTEKVKRSHPWYWIAATFTGLLIIAAAYHFFFAEKMITEHTTYGETKHIVMSDGTLITLNANSTLVYSSRFDQKREVWLNGEAFFEVEELVANPDAGFSTVQDERVKFTVYTERLAVEVTGTSFNVNDRENKTQVVLNTGKIKLKNQLTANTQEDILVMQPGDMVEIFEGEGKMIKKVVDPEVYTSWKDNRLVCYDTPLKAIAQIISSNYGMQMVFEDAALSEMVVTGTLPANNLDLLLEVLAESMGLHINKTANTITVKENKR